MSTREVFMAGLPAAGKTTFIAALWHQVYACEGTSKLAFESIEGLDVGYLNQLRFAWLQAKKPERTKLGQEKTAVINLRSESGDTLRLSLEDFAGEGFRQMWSRRMAPAKVADIAQRADRHLLIVNIAKVVYPRTANELALEVAAAKASSAPALGTQVSEAGAPPVAGENASAQTAPSADTPFDPRKCPTAAQLTDILQLLMRPPIAAKPKKVAIALTAWDEVADEGLSPAGMLTERLPLLAQFIEANADTHTFRVFGVSAQGGSYDTEPARTRVLNTETQSDRILLVDGDEQSHDLTRMLAWLLE